MTCVELQESLVEIEDARSAEQQAHLRNCSECAKLVGDLLVIACSAGDLRESHDPDPRVWKSIESSLRREGLIRPQRRSLSLVPSLGSQWGWARWLVPAAALMLVSLGIFLRQHSRTPDLATNDGNAAQVVSDAAVAGLNDDDLLQEAAQQSPALQEQYAENLRHVNQYIQDAKNVVAADPNDEEARLSLMEAYQEKAMLFELALDRSLQ
jgi:hypothetical protein